MLSIDALLKKITNEVKLLVGFQVDFDEMESKCSSNQYRIAEEFRADAQLIVHNIVIYHGGEVQVLRPLK